MLERDVLLYMLLTNGLLQDRNGRLAVNEERVDELRTNPWSTIPVDVSELISLLGAHTKTPRRILDKMCNESLLYIDRHQVSFLYPCHAVELARCAVDLNRGKGLVIARSAHLLLNSGCPGLGSLNHYMQGDILHFAICTDLFAADELSLGKDKFSFAEGRVSLGEQQITELDDFPFCTVFERTVDKGSDGMWLERGADGTVEVHLLQIKVSASGTTLDAGKDPCSRTETTLATIKYRLVQAFVDFKSQLEAAEVDTSRLKLALLHLLSTAQVCEELTLTLPTR